jgi:predicted nucleotidyltransferase
MVQRIGYPEYRPLLDEFIALVQETLAGKVVSVVLYGSVARWDAGRQSDIDVLLVLEEAAPSYYERLQMVLSVLRRLHEGPCWQELVAEGFFPELNVLILSRAEAEQNRGIFLDMIEDARVLVDRDGFFRHRLGLLQKRLLELGARKVRRNGTWYWDLKPDLKLGEAIAL